MKNKIHTILAFFVMTAFLLGTMGFGVHRCDIDHTAKVILLAGETPCEHAHTHDHPHDHPHDHSCCHTDVFVVDAPSVSSHNVSLPSLVAQTLPDMIGNDVSSPLNQPIPENRLLARARSIPPEDTCPLYLSMLSLRL